MNSSFSFLDTSGPPMPRQAPSPSPSAASAAAQQQAQAHQNGMSPMNAQPNGVPMVNGLPSGGQQTDMNHLWGVVQQLSQLLEENRAQTVGLVNGVQTIQARAAEEGGLSLREVNGELNSAARAADIASLTSQLQASHNTINDLSTSNTSLTNLITDYEIALTLLLDKLRPYAYNQTQAMVALHKHYQQLIEEERASSMQLRLEHAEWQAGLGRAAEYARLALKVQSEGERPYQREIKELKEENRVLRRLAGWEEKEDTSSDEEAEEEGNLLRP